MRLYDAVIYAVGAQSDRKMGIPGEDLPGSLPATAFVAWYNGHPDYADLDVDLSAKRVVVIGNGNVAVDVTRMLALTREELSPTDTADAAIEALCASGVEEIVMVGRRGPAQAAFTTPELQELGELAGADVVVDPADLELDPASEASLEENTTARRNVEILREYATRKRTDKPKAVELRFLWSPVAINGDERVESIELVRNELSEDGKRAVRPARPRRSSAGSSCALSATAACRSRTCPSTRAAARSATRTAASSTRPARTSRASTAPAGSSAARAGSSARTRRTRPRPSSSCSRTPPPVASAPPRRRRRRRSRRCSPSADAAPIEYDGWTAIDTHERTAGEPHGRPRVKLCSWDELLAARAARSPPSESA